MASRDEVGSSRIMFLHQLVPCENYILFFPAFFSRPRVTKRIILLFVEQTNIPNVVPTQIPRKLLRIVFLTTTQPMGVHMKFVRR